MVAECQRAGDSGGRARAHGEHEVVVVKPGTRRQAHIPPLRADCLQPCAVVDGVEIGRDRSQVARAGLGRRERVCGRSGAVREAPLGGDKRQLRRGTAECTERNGRFQGGEATAGDHDARRSGGAGRRARHTHEYPPNGSPRHP